MGSSDSDYAGSSKFDRENKRDRKRQMKLDKRERKAQERHSKQRTGPPCQTPESAVSDKI
jgi:hypothetical protein